MMDRNSIIGLVLISGLLIGYMFYMQPSAEEIAKQKRMRDSLALVEQEKEVAAAKAKVVVAQKPNDTIANTVASVADTSINLDSIAAINKAKAYGIFAPAVGGEDKLETIENDLLKINVSARGGRIASVELKKYKTFDGKPLILFTPDSSQQALLFPANSSIISTDSLYFDLVKSNGGNSIEAKLRTTDPKKYVSFNYTVKPDNYLIDFSLNVNGLQDVIASNATDLTLHWQMKTPSLEKSHDNQKNASTIYFKYADDEVDYLSETSDEQKALEAKIKWVAFKQQFFTSVLLAGTSFEKPSDIEQSSVASKDYVKNMRADLTVPYSHNASEKFDMQFYFGPNHYNTLKEYDLALEKQIPLGWGIFGWVNRGIVIPIFNFLSGFALNYGIIILILTIIIKALLFPIAYKTYLSSAKMRVLKPEVDAINKKHENDDPMKKQQAVMGLYRKAGVNPMAGCVPLLLQFPILIALFRFFPASIELRQQAFLWADDLSTYDSIYNLPFNIPFYGDHVSLFTLLMTISTLLYTYSNSQMMDAGTQMPGMKVMMYIMPVMFMGIFNGYSSGLSYYYFLANMITFGQTFVMRRFVDEDKLKRIIEENKKKPAKPSSSFQQRLEKMARERQQQAQQIKKKK